MRRVVACIFFIQFAIFAVAQTAGDLDTTKTAVTYTSTFNNVILDPSPKIGTSTRKQLTQKITTDDYALGGAIGTSRLMQVIPRNAFSNDMWNVLNGIGTFTGASVTPKFDIGGSGTFGAYMEVNDIGTADIDVDYPIDVDVIYPEANTFACGDDFIIRTEWSVREKPGMLKVTPPFLEMELGPIVRDVKVDASIGITVSACIGAQIPYVGCGGYPINHTASFSSPSLTLPIPSLPPAIRVCEDAFGNNKSDVDIIRCSSNLGATFFSIAKNHPDLKYKSMSTITPTKIIVKPPPVKVKVEMDGEFNKITKNALNYQSLNQGKNLRAFGTVAKTSKYRFDLVSLLEFKKVPTKKSLGPLGGYDVGDIAPNLRTDQVMDYRFNPKVNMEVDLGVAMRWEVHDANHGVMSSGNSRYVQLLAGQWIKATYPDHLSDPSQVTSASKLEAKFKTKSTQKYYAGIDFSFIELKILDYEKTLYETNLYEKYLGADVLQDHTINLNNFSTKSLNNFSLDPEKPIINVTDFEVQDVRNVGNGERLVVYRADIKNDGDVKLSNTRVELDLDKAFGSANSFRVECVASSSLTPNNNYDGVNDLDLLAGSDMLAIGEEASVEILVWVDPQASAVGSQGCFGTVEYDAYTQAFAQSPIGTNIQSNIYQCDDSRTADDIVSTVDLGASQIATLSQYTIYGGTEVKFSKEQLKSKGNVGSPGKVIYENVTQGNQSRVQLVGDIHAGDHLFLQGQSRIEADYVQSGKAVKIPNKASSLVTTGALSEKSKCVSTFKLPSMKLPANSSRKRINVRAGQTMSLSSGDYAEIRLNKASVLKLDTGIYNIGRWVFMGDDGQVIFNTADGDVTLNVTSWQPLQRDDLQFTTNTPNTENQVTYKTSATHMMQFSNALVQGIIWAPNGTVKFDDGSVLQGKCYANKVTFARNSSFSDPVYNKDIDVDPSCISSSAPLAETYDETDAYSGYSNASTGSSSSDRTATLVDMLDVLKVYPNPARTDLIVESPEYMDEIILRDALGRVVMHEIVHTKRISLDISRLPDGMYTVESVLQDRVEVTKLIKHRG